MSLATLKARVAALQAGSQVPAPPSDPVVLTSVLTAALAGKVTADPNGQVRTDRYAPASITGAKFADPRRSQFLAALEASGAGRVAKVRDAVPSDVGNAINIAWNSTALVTASGPLAQHVKTTLGLTDAQLNAILADALTRPE